MGKPILLLLLGLEFVAWLVAMAGTAAAAADNVPAATLGYAWWAVWGQFFLLCFVGLTAFMASEDANRLRTYLMMMLTVVWMQVADKAREWLDAPWAQGDLKTDAQTILAGAILVMLFNFVFIIHAGLSDHGTKNLSLRKSVDTAPNTEAGKAPEESPAV